MPPLCGKVLGGHACSTHKLCDLWVYVHVHVMCIQQEYTCVSIHMCEHAMHMYMLCACMRVVCVVHVHVCMRVVHMHA